MSDVKTREQGVSFICHLAESNNHFAHHRSCDGNSYTPNITDHGTPCQCSCHTAGWDKA